MSPIKTKESNFVYRGPTAEIADCPCRREYAVTFIVWEPTDDEREALAAGAYLRLGIYGLGPIPPVSLAVAPQADCHERVPDPCLLCGRSVEDAVHLSGPGTHAFRSGLLRE